MREFNAQLEARQKSERDALLALRKKKREEARAAAEAQRGAAFDEAVNANTQQANAASVTPCAVKSEIDKYLDEVVAIEIDPLQWWSTNEKRFPHVARRARQFLGCPATSASAERVFSLAGRLYSDLRQHMTDGTLEERMWAKVNRTLNK